MPEENIYRISNSGEFQEGKIKFIESDTATFAIVKSNGKFYAFKHECPHHGANFKDGITNGKSVICPWHHANFDIESGAMIEPPGPEALEVFPVIEKNGELYINLSSVKKIDVFSKEVNYSNRPIHAIIGAGAAGATAAETLRKNGFEGKIILISREETEYYDRTLLSKEFLFGGDDFKRIPVRNSEFYKKAGIERLTGEVKKLDTAASKIIFMDGNEIHFDKLLIASGGIPVKPPIPGIDDDNIYTLRSLADAKKIKQAAQKYSKVVIVGASFIGMECAASLRKRGLDVTVIAIESVPFEHVLGVVLGKNIQKLHENKGVRFYLGHSIKKFSHENDNVLVELEDGTIIEGGFVILGTGVRPATGFLEPSILENDGSLKVDSFMHVLKAPENIFAAGDIATFPYKTQGNHIRVEHWRVAEQLGICAAKNMQGIKCEIKNIPLFWTDQFHMNLCYVGYTRGWDEIIIDGKLEKDFIAFYIKDNKVQAAAGKWRDADMCAIEECMKMGTMPSVDKIKNGFIQWQEFNQ